MSSPMSSEKKMPPDLRNAMANDALHVPRARGQSPHPCPPPPHPRSPPPHAPAPSPPPPAPPLPDPPQHFQPNLHRPAIRLPQHQGEPPAHDLPRDLQSAVKKNVTPVTRPRGNAAETYNPSYPPTHTPHSGQDDDRSETTLGSDGSGAPSWGTPRTHHVDHGAYISQVPPHTPGHPFQGRDCYNPAYPGHSYAQPHSPPPPPPPPTYLTEPSMKPVYSHPVLPNFGHPTTPPPHGHYHQWPVGSPLPDEAPPPLVPSPDVYGATQSFPGSRSSSVLGYASSWGRPEQVITSVELQMSGSKLDKKDFFGKSDGYCIIKRDGQEMARTNVVNRSLNPRWEPVTLHFKDAVRVADIGLVHFSIEVWDADKGKRDDEIGTVTCTLLDMRRRTNLTLINSKNRRAHKNKSSGTLLITKCKPHVYTKE